MISREKCLEWARQANLIKPEPAFGHVIGIENMTYANIEALINHAYAEGQKDMRERAATKAASYRMIGAGTIAGAIRDLEIE